MNRALLVIFALVLPISAKPQPDITGKVVGIHDGDTLTILTVES